MRCWDQQIIFVKRQNSFLSITELFLRSIMSETMDFTDMFQTSKPVAPKPRLSSMKRTQHQPPSTERSVPAVAEKDVQENIPPSQSNLMADSDSMVFVKNNLRHMNLDIQSKDLSQAALQAIEMLFSEVPIMPSTYSSIYFDVLCLKYYLLYFY